VSRECLLTHLRYTLGLRGCRSVIATILRCFSSLICQHLVHCFVTCFHHYKYSGFFIGSVLFSIFPINWVPLTFSTSEFSVDGIYRHCQFCFRISQPFILIGSSSTAPSPDGFIMRFERIKFRWLVSSPRISRINQIATSPDGFITCFSWCQSEFSNCDRPYEWHCSHSSEILHCKRLWSIHITDLWSVTFLSSLAKGSVL
jgi:hypothetical protein